MTSCDLTLTSGQDWEGQRAPTKKKKGSQLISPHLLSATWHSLMSGFLDNDRASGLSIEDQKAVYLAGLAVALVGTIARFLSYRGNARLIVYKPWVRRMGDVAVGISFALVIVIFI